MLKTTLVGNRVVGGSRETHTVVKVKNVRTHGYEIIFMGVLTGFDGLDTHVA